jgi:transcriptional regulator with XRE-family HTH domain
MDGKEVRRVLSWLLNRDLTDADLADALGVSPPTYSRHKDDDDYPSHEELDRLGCHFGLSPLALQVAFGTIGINGLMMLNDDEMRLYLEQGGGNHPSWPLEVVRHPLATTTRKEVPKARRYASRPDKPPL